MEYDTTREDTLRGYEQDFRMELARERQDDMERFADNDKVGALAHEINEE